MALCERHWFHVNVFFLSSCLWWKHCIKTLLFSFSLIATTAVVYTTCPDKIVMCRFLYSTPIDRTRDESYYLFHPYRQDPWCVVLFIPPLSTGPVMCRFLYFTPIDRTSDVSFSLFHPYRQDPWCVVFFIPPLSTGPGHGSYFLFHLFIPPLSTGPVMCRIIYSTPIDRTRDVSDYLFHPYRQDPWSPRATRGYQNEARKGRLCCCSNIYLITHELWKFVAGVQWLSRTAICTLS